MLNKSQSNIAQFLRYTVVGGMAFVVDFLSLYLLVQFAGMHYVAAACLAYLAGMVCNYMCSIHWVFGFRRVAHWQHEFAIFFSIGIAGLVLNGLLISLGVEVFGFAYLTAKLYAGALILLFNFTARKVLLFSAITLQRPRK
ncbi:GtrA family protein [Pseudoduganella sp. OTU4001]|uniref:GtrA family protein n=1 Tax=Pseudoduganella sp. OTU4001 TaxID=3043854 RepID=UPI00313BA2B8